MATEEEIVQYGRLERRIIQIGLEAKIPYEELRDWYCDLLLGEMQMGELIRMVEQRVSDPRSRRELAELKASVPSVVQNG